MIEEFDKLSHTVGTSNVETMDDITSNNFIW